MFRLLNKSAIWHLCQCVNYYEIRRHGPSRALYFSPLLDPSHLPAVVGPGYVGGWSVRQSVVSNFSRYSGAQVHLGVEHSKQWAALNASSLWALNIPRSRTWQHPWSTPAAYL